MASANRHSSRPSSFFGAILLILLAVPIVQNHVDRPRDGFPLSYYPMFSHERSNRTTLRRAVGLRADGSEVPLHYKLAGSGGMNQVRRQMRSRIKGGGAEELAQEIHDNLLETSRYDDVVEILIVRDRFRLDRVMSGERTPDHRKVYVRMPVRRKESS